MGANENEKWYEDLREKHRPQIVKILLIGESPPDPKKRGRRFFYSPELTYDNLFRGVAQAVYGEDVDVSKKASILRRFQKDVFWLIDACARPVNSKKNSDRNSEIRKSVPDLIKRCRDIAPTHGIIVCHGRVYRIAGSSLRQEGIKVLHRTPIPFPLGNCRRQFIEKFREAIENSGLKR